MSEKGSVFQKGGGGTNFEQAVQTAFLCTLIIRGNAPCLPANEVIEVSFQNTNKGYQTDDLLVVAKSSLGKHNLLMQIKHDISFTVGNEIFKEVMQAFWKDFNNQALFDRTKDKLIIVKNGLTKDERNHLKSLFNWANTHATETDFLLEVNRIQSKKERLEMFRQVLTEANGNAAISDKELWEFLKCSDVLEYDFLNEGSVDETYFLNLIRLSKSKEAALTDKEIWNSILSFVARLNKDGGNVTIESIQNEELFLHFAIEKLTPYLKAIEKLKNDGNIILKPLKNTIGELHLNRASIGDTILEKIASFKFTIVTGRPGVGKSAVIKDVLFKNFPDASKFIFRADQFNKPHLANVFADLGINVSIIDIISCISLIPDKIIFIDSLEKLLEAESEHAFKQLLILLKEYPDIKIVTSSRKYAIDLITQKFDLQKEQAGIVEVAQLNDEELNTILEKYPQLKGLMKTHTIKNLLRSPKYLDFTISALQKSPDDYSNISLSAFKNKLWDALVVDTTNIKDGLTIKRENAFMEIAVKRAKEMKLFTRPMLADPQAILLLEKDEIIFQEINKRNYAPSHDILEDWALVRFVSSKYDEYASAKDFFEQLGNEPAIRRAFRLWVEDFLITDSSKVQELIQKSLADTSIEKYWADELLIAVFKSEDCSSFFKSFEKELLKNDGSFLNRCMHLLRTACKEAYADNPSILLPIGSGWKEMLFFIKNNINHLNKLRLSVYNILYDWEYLLLFQYVADEEAIATKEIVLHFLNQIENGDEFWDERLHESRIKGLVMLLFNLAQVAKAEISHLVDRAYKRKEDNKNWKIKKFYEIVVDGCLSGLNTQRLTKECPELVIQTAWKEWKLRPVEPPPDGSISALIGSSGMRDDDCWGIEDKFTFFPSGIYKTPVYNLLQYHPLLALEFITGFLNYSVDFYVNADCRYKHQISKVEVSLNDGTIVSQWANWELWVAYRGLSVTHYLIESILMSLEKYLLDTAQLKTEVSKSNIKFIFDYLFRNSNNVITTSVLASVAMAYPEVSEEEIVPLLSVKEFYEWETSRVLQESAAVAPIDNNISFAQEERFKSNRLPHRTKFLQGMSDFIINYQFNVRTANEQIHALFDKLHLSVKNDDIFWKKKLSEIDVRKWDIKQDAVNNQIILQPKYDDEVEEFLDSGKEEMEAQRVTMKWTQLIWDVYEGKKSMSLEIWQEAFNYYNQPETADIFYDRPVSLAVIGLRDFNKHLSDEQKEWCISKIKQTLIIILDDAMNGRYNLNRSYNLMEKKVALQSPHFLAANTKNESEMKEVLQLTFYTLIAPFGDHETKENIEYVKTTFFNKFPFEAKKIWACLIKYAQFRKSKPFYYDDHDANRLAKAKQDEKAFIESCLNEENIAFKIEDIDLNNCESYLIFRAFLITPSTGSDNLFFGFIKKILSIITVELQLDEDRYYNRKNRQRKIDRRDISGSEPFVADILLNTNHEFSKEIIHLLLQPILVDRELSIINAKDLYEFIKMILEFIVLKIFDAGNLQPVPPNYQQQLNKFWKLWEYLFNVLKATDEKPFVSTLLFNIQYLLFDYQGKPIELQWKALEEQKEFYYKMVQEVGENHVNTILNVFSIAGEKTFLPEGLTLIVNLIKKNSSQKIVLINPSAERFVKKLYHNHMSTIKNSKKLIEDFIWLLNEMVDLGSSSAYLFRENVITYKKAY